MTTISRNRRRGSRAPLLWGALFLVVLVAALVWRAQFAGLLWRALAPAMEARNAFFAGDADVLRAQLASTTALVADRDALYQENLQLKALLGRANPGLHMVLAGVIARPPALPYDTLIIDAGQAQGIADGMLVSAGGTTVIGQVSNVYPTTARVELYSAPGANFNGLLLHEGSKAVPIALAGQGGGSLTAQIPANTAVSVGDAIVLPGVAGGFGGTVSAVQTQKGSSFITLYMQLPVDPLALRYVEVQLTHAQ